jgi:DNA-binding IclR family transcriptional regulator
VNKSVYRATKILEHVAFSKEPQSLADICNTSDLPKSSASDVIKTLIDCDYLRSADGNAKTYELSWKLFNIGTTLLGKTNLYKTAKHHLVKLLEETQQTIYLAIEDKGNILYVDKAELNAAYKMTCDVGDRNKMHCTGLGKALLAAYTKDRVAEIVKEHGLLEMTENTITTPDALEKELEISRTRGFALDLAESDDELVCVAVPVYDRTNLPVAAISISSLKYKVDDEKIQEFSRKITKTALAISADLGYSKDHLY